MRQEHAGGLLDFYQFWQKSLYQLSHSHPLYLAISRRPFPDGHQIGGTISNQIFELLGQNIYSPHLEADLIRLRQLFVDFDSVQAPQERQTRLIQAKKILISLKLTRKSGGSPPTQTRVPERQFLTAEVENLPRIPSMTNKTELWNLPIRFAKGVGPSRARLLEKLGVTTIEDALWFLPWRYEDWSVIVPIGSLEAGMKATVKGKVTSSRVRRTSRKGMVILTISIDDGTGSLDAVFFNQPFLEQIFLPGTRVLLRGETSNKAIGFAPLQMQSPQHEIVQIGGDPSGVPKPLVPVYHETKGLTSRQFRRIVRGLYDLYSYTIEEILPLDLFHELQLPSLRAAISELHFPVNTDSLDQLNEGTTPLASTYGL